MVLITERRERTMRYEMTVIYDEPTDSFEVMASDEPILDVAGPRDLEAFEEGETLEWAVDHVKTSLGEFA
jgi:hypothetical protein